jgi:hypothetical protein
MAVTIPSKTYPYPGIYYFLIYTFSFWIQYEIKNIASLHDTRRSPAVAGSLISKVVELELVEANTDFFYFSFLPPDEMRIATKPWQVHP